MNPTEPAHLTAKITDFINGPVTYEANGGQYFWITEPDGGWQMLGELRGWGRIQTMFEIPGGGGKVDFKAAEAFQDELGQFVAEAINEKIQRLALDQEAIKK